MSSHYVIRDYQEPAILILDFAATYYEVVCALLEWQPFIIGESKRINEFELRDIRPDILFRKQDEIIEDNLLDQYKILEYQHNDLLTDVIDFLAEKSIPGLNIISPFTVDLQRSLENSKSDLYYSVFQENKRFSLVKSGKFKKWAHSLQGFILPDKKVSIKNLEPIDEHHVQSKKEGIIEVISDESFWIGEIIC